MLKTPSFEIVSPRGWPLVMDEELVEIDAAVTGFCLLIGAPFAKEERDEPGVIGLLSFDRYVRRAPAWMVVMNAVFQRMPATESMRYWIAACAEVAAHACEMALDARKALIDEITIVALLGDPAGAYAVTLDAVQRYKRGEG